MEGIFDVAVGDPPDYQDEDEKNGGDNGMNEGEGNCCYVGNY